MAGKKYVSHAEAAEAFKRGANVTIVSECEGFGYERLWDGEPSEGYYYIEDSENTWSSTLPTTPDWYWVRFAGKKPRVEKIFLNVENELCCKTGFGLCRIFTGHFNGVLWQKVKPYDE